LIRLEDSSLISQLQNGEESAFRYLVENYQQKIYHTCLGFLKNEEEADDKAQEVFIEIYESIHGFRQDSKLSTWIYRIAVTKSLEALRRKKQKKRNAHLLSYLGIQGEAFSIQADKFYHPGVQLENKERASILFKTIEQLPENQGIAFTLHKVQGMSYAEIAEIMGTSISAVESLMFRARKNLQKKLRIYYESDKT